VARGHDDLARRADVDLAACVADRDQAVLALDRGAGRAVADWFLPRADTSTSTMPSTTISIVSASKRRSSSWLRGPSANALASPNCASMRPVPPVAITVPAPSACANG
jgi:hypothetical protein